MSFIITNQRGLLSLMSILLLTSLLITAPAQEPRETLKRRADALVREGERLTKYYPGAGKGLLEEAARIYRRLNARREEADALRKDVQAMTAPHVPFESLQRLLDLDRSLGAPSKVIAEDLRNLGLGFFDKQRDFQKAFHYVNEAIKMASGDKKLLARCHASKGTMHNFRGEVVEAMREWKEALRLAREVKDQSLEVRALCNLGEWQFERGQHDDARRNLEQALELAKKRDRTLTEYVPWWRNKTMLGDCRATLARMEWRLGRPPHALKLYREACQDMLEGDAQGIRQMLFIDMADIYAAQGDYVHAERYYELSLIASAPPPAAGDPWMSLKARVGYGGYLSRKGQHADALVLFEEALQIAEHNENFAYQADCLLRMGFALLGQKNPQRAQQRFDESLKVIQKSVPIPDLKWRAHHGRGRALADQGKHDEAVKEYEKAIETLDLYLKGVPQSSEDPARMDTSLWTPYHDALLVYYKRGDKERAFRLSERAKVGLIALTSRRVNVSQWMNAKDRAEEQHLRERVNRLRYACFSPEAQEKRNIEAVRDLTQAEGDYDHFMRTVSLRYPKVSAARGHLPSIGLTEAQAIAAKAGVTILDYVVTDNTVLVFVIDRQGMTSRLLDVRPKTLKNRVISTSVTYPQAAFQLYQELVQPLEARLKNARALCIIPDDVLWSVPFEVLWKKKDKSSRYLFQDFSISYAPSVSALNRYVHRTAQPRRHVSWRVAALGNPDFGSKQVREDAIRGDGLARLSVEELSMFPRLFGSGATVYQKAQATEAAAQRALGQSYDLVHFGCHSIYNHIYPLYSSLVLTPRKGTSSEDGWLEAREIANLDIKTRLVVLAACETGRGEPTRGHGLIGMTWATFIGGAPACVATRWKVDDKATAKLVEEFYKNLKKGNSNAESLRRAQLSLLKHKTYQRPYYWAGVMLMGR